MVALDPTHVSAYSLTVEPGTPLAADPDRHPDDDDQAAKYLHTVERLAAAGYRWYEVSNWARPGHECRHNLPATGRAGDYLGFGCAAHSHVAGRRWWNLRTPERYIDAVDAGRPTEAAGETLDAETRRIEALQLRCAPATACRPRALDLDDPALDGLRRRGRATGWCSPRRSAAGQRGRHPPRVTRAGVARCSAGRDRWQLEDLAGQDEVGIAGVDQPVPVASR